MQDNSMDVYDIIKDFRTNRYLIVTKIISIDSFYCIDVFKATDGNKNWIHMYFNNVEYTSNSSFKNEILTHKNTDDIKEMIKMIFNVEEIQVLE